MAGRGRTSERGERGVQRQPATTAMKTPECGGLRGTDKADTTCHLPQQFRGGGTHFLASTESDTMSALGTRISLEAFKRNPSQPSELT